MALLLSASFSIGFLISPSPFHSTGSHRSTLLLGPPAPELSRPFSADFLGRRATRVKIVATPTECTALANRFEVLSIGGITANVSFSRAKHSSRIRASGMLAASDVVMRSLTQSTHTVQVGEVEFETWFQPEEDLGTLQRQLELSGDDAFDEAIEDGQVL